MLHSKFFIGNPGNRCTQAALICLIATTFVADRASKSHTPKPLSLPGTSHKPTLVNPVSEGPPQRGLAKIPKPLIVRAFSLLFRRSLFGLLRLLGCKLNSFQSSTSRNQLTLNSKLNNSKSQNRPCESAKL